MIGMGGRANVAYDLKGDPGAVQGLYRNTWLDLRDAR